MQELTRDQGTMIKLAIFDLDGVLLNSKFLSDLIEQKYGIPSDEVFKALFENVLKPAEKGSTFKKLQPDLKKWKVDLPENEFLEFWRESERPEVNEEVVLLLKKLKKNGTKVVLLTDNVPERMDWLKKKFSFFDLFDKVYCSFELGCLKSNQKAMDKILSDFGVSPKEAFHVDDNKSIISRSKKLGLSAYHFGSAEGLRKLIETW